MIVMKYAAILQIVKLLNFAINSNEINELVVADT